MGHPITKDKYPFARGAGDFSDGRTARRSRPSASHLLRLKLHFKLLASQIGGRTDAGEAIASFQCYRDMMIQALHSFCIKEMLLSRLIFPRGSFFAGRARTRKLRGSPRVHEARHAGAFTPARLCGWEDARREGVRREMRWTKVMARHSKR